MKVYAQLTAIATGPVIFLVLLLLPAPAGIPPEAWRLIAVFAWMISWWLTEAIPLAATALLPVILLPFLGILPVAQVTQSYGHPLIFLFLGGFMLAMAIQSAGLHRRIALHIVSWIGTSPRRLMLGFMVATAALSMWITNTSATIMMFAVALSVVDFVRAHDPNEAGVRRFAVGLLLAVAYSASIGGVGTLIGSPVNGLLASVLAGEYGITIEFVDWFLIGFPFVIVMLVFAWLLMSFVLFPPRASVPVELDSVITTELAALGAMSRHEKIVLGVFAFAAIGWIFGDQIEQLTGLPINDTAVAIAAAVLLFATPVNIAAGKFALDWETAKQLPWNVLILIGGGLAMASAVQATGLAGWIGEAVDGIKLPTLLLILFVVVVMVSLTEVMSNPASAATLLPIFAAISVGLDFSPLLLAVPATIAANMSFMMPVATAPNAIVFSYTDMRMADMIRAGFFLNLVAIIVCTVGVYAVMRPIYGW